MDLNIVAAVFIVAMIVLIMLGMNLGLTMFLTGFLGYAYVISPKAAMGVFQTAPITFALNYTLSVVPMFVLMGQFAYRSGLSTDLFDAAQKWFGRVRGGQALATIMACCGFGAICGSLTATTATMATVAYPEMKKNKYDPALSGGCIASGGTLGVLIPPSTPFILYGIITETSIGKLFAAGIVPGILMMVSFIFVILLQVFRNPSLAPKGNRYTIREKLGSLKSCIGMLILFTGVIGGMFAGIFSSTEAAGVGALLSLIFMAAKRQATLDNIIASLQDTLRIVGMSMLIIIGAFMLGYFLAVTKMPMSLALWVESLDVAPVVVIMMIIALYAFMGCFMDASAMTLLTIPILLPIIETLGYDLIWFGVVIIMVQNLGAITPPVGMSCFIAAGTIKEIPLSTIYKGTLPMFLAFLVCFILVVYFPAISLWLPNLLYGG